MNVKNVTAQLEGYQMLNNLPRCPQLSPLRSDVMWLSLTFFHLTRHEGESLRTGKWRGKYLDSRAPGPLFPTQAWPVHAILHRPIYQQAHPGLKIEEIQTCSPRRARVSWLPTSCGWQEVSLDGITSTSEGTYRASFGGLLEEGTW